MSDTFDKAFWEEHYARNHGAAGHGPNPHLVAAAEPLPAGTALDAGCGEGANARWLATQGWRVTAVDIATGALRRAQDQAATMGPDIAARVDWMAVDLTQWTPPEGQFQLVYSLYVHVAGSSPALFRRLAAAVAPRGTLLIVGHYPSDEHTHTPAAGSFVTADEIAATLDQDRWHVEVADAIRQSNRHSGDEIVHHDAVVRARRRG